MGSGNFFEKIKSRPLEAILGPRVGGFLSDPLGGTRRREEGKQQRAREAELGELGRAEALYQSPLFDAEAMRRAGEARIGGGFDQARTGLRGGFASRGLFRSGPALVNEALLEGARGSALAGMEADIVQQRMADEQMRRAALAGIYGQRGAILGQPITHPRTDAMAGALGQLAGTALGGMFGGPAGAMAGGQMGGSMFGGFAPQQQQPRQMFVQPNIQPNVFGNPYAMSGFRFV